MRAVIVPNVVRDTIEKKLAYATVGMDIPESDLDDLYHQLLEFFDKHGYVPDFDIERK